MYQSTNNVKISGVSSGVSSTLSVIIISESDAKV